jgi:CMP-N-acetylneuraminic acid synthetase
VIAVACVFARGGSKGIPNKNILPLGGKPLIHWAIASAKSVERVGRVMVSTDSEHIAEAARIAGADVPFMRPAELATDTSPEWLSWRHALEYLHATDGRSPDALVVVPATAPLRSRADIERCLDEYERGDADVVITMTDAHRSPYFNMIRVGDDGYAHLVNPPSGAVTRRQDVPVVFDMTTVCYVLRPEFVMRANGMFEGRIRAVHIPTERAIDIDTPLDFQIAELMLARAQSASE